ncbi:MAG: ATP-binding protein, partial [Oscillospiraceae bacterium]|nr:ATP-binding protein [Oscillospiraceae bacterium]
GQSNEIDVYLNKLDEDLTSVDTIIKSGNIMLDAILNSKLSLAASKKISINAKAAAPKTINISDIDLCVTVGNLLDNAIEACMKIDNEDKRFIRVYIGIFKEQLYISVSNSAGPGVKKHSGRYMTTKAGSHGFGLLRVDNIIQKYGGYINRQNEVGVFATEIMLPK